MRQWSAPIALSRFKDHEVPECSGVYVLLQSETDPACVLLIAPAKNLREAYTRELHETKENRPVPGKGFVYFRAAHAAQEADEFLGEYKNRRGERPLYNSGF
tara:strand:- start:416 stop:721 length:306 start_codon:yes stop_codon:yes gene_type:complete